MAMSQSELATQLKAMVLYATEAAAAEAWAAAFAAYFEGDGVTHGAESNAVYVASTLMAAAKLDMQTALGGMSDPGAGAAKIKAGIQAFWAVLVALPASAWATVTVIVPPIPLVTLDTVLQATFEANRNGDKSKDDSMDAIAADIHAATSPVAVPDQGKATWPGPTVLPIT